MEHKSFSSLEGELKRFSPAVLAEFQKASLVAMERLAPHEFHDWAREGIAIAKFSFRAWEAASEYFRVTNKVTIGQTSEKPFIRKPGAPVP